MSDITQHHQSRIAPRLKVLRGSSNNKPKPKKGEEADAKAEVKPDAVLSDITQHHQSRIVDTMFIIAGPGMVGKK